MAPKKTPLPKPTPKASAPTPPPDWPAFKPLLPPTALALSTVTASQIVVVRNFWTAALCRTYVAFLKRLPLTTTPGRPKKGEALRVNDRLQVVDEAFASRLWSETGLRELVCGGGEEGEGEGEGDEGMSKEERRELWSVLHAPKLKEPF
jgi:hypothetical protein